MNDFLDRAHSDQETGGEVRRASQPQANADVAIGFDLGGTNFRAALFSGLNAIRQGRTDELIPLAKFEEPIGPQRSPRQLAARVATVVHLLEQQANLQTTHVGVGFAGMLAADQSTVVNAPHYQNQGNSRGNGANQWENVNFGRLLNDALLPSSPSAATETSYSVRLYNDVNAITVAECMAGAGIGMSDVLTVFVGTGIGSGLIQNGTLIQGASGCAAELGHCKVVLDQHARPCACGMRGCIEAYVGGAYLARRAQAELRGGARSLAPSIAGGIESIMPSHLDQAAARGDDYALELFAEIAPLLGAAIANALTLINPALLILGGGMLSRMPVFQQHVMTTIDVAINPPAGSGLKICSALLGENAGPLGAALLASSQPSQDH